MCIGVFCVSIYGTKVLQMGEMAKESVNLFYKLKIMLTKTLHFIVKMCFSCNSSITLQTSRHLVAVVEMPPQDKGWMSKQCLGRELKEVAETSHNAVEGYDVGVV